MRSQLASACRIFVLPRSGALAAMPDPWHFITMDDDLPLAAEFPPATREQWRKLVEAVLEKRPHDRTLISHTYDGLAIEPLYMRRADAQPLAGRAAGLAWQIMQRVDHPDPSVANTEALHELENGATGLALVFAGSIGAYGYGLDASEPAIARALDGVHLDADIALDLDLGPQGYDDRPVAGVPGAATRHCSCRHAHPVRLRPHRCCGASGGSPLPWDGFVPTFNAVITKLAAQGFRGPFAQADGRLIHNAGGSEAQELAYVLAAAARVSARTGGGRPRTRCRARHDLLPSCRRCRSISHRCQVSCAAQALGAGRECLRPDPETCLPCRGNRLAHDDQARSLRELVARDPRRLLGCSRRRGRGHRAAVHHGARAARPFRATHRSQHAAHSHRGSEPRKSRRSCGRCRRHRRISPINCVLRPGRSFRT